MSINTVQKMHMLCYMCIRLILQNILHTDFAYVFIHSQLAWRIAHEIHLTISSAVSLYLS